MKCSAATAADVDIAMKAAYKAQYGNSWGIATTGAFRAQKLKQMGADLKANLEEWAEAETRDCGKPIVESRADMEACIAMFDYFADLAEKLDVQNAAPVDTMDETCS